MALVQWNSLRIEGNNNLVFQDAHGTVQHTTIEAFVQLFTAEKDKRIEVLEKTIDDKVKIERYDNAEIQRLGRQLTQLKEERDFQETRINEMLREFDGKDVSHSSKLYQEAFALFLSGKLADALTVLDETKLAQQEAQSQALREQQADTRLLKAEMLQLNFQFAAAAHNLEKATQINPTWKSHLTTANFYSAQKDYQKVATHYQQALQRAAHDAERAATLNNLGVFYSTNQKMPQAEAAYNEALKMYRQLADKNPDAFLPDVAMTLNNLIILNFEQPKAAENYLKESLPIRRKLAQANPDAQDLELARTLIIGGFVYEGLGNVAQSQAFFKEALSIAMQYPDVPLAQQLISKAKKNSKP